MFKYVLKRIGFAFLTCFIILSITFLLMKSLPIDRPIGQEKQQIAYCEKQVYLGYFYKFTEEQKDLGHEVFRTSEDPKTKTVTYYYQVPSHQQYWKWLKNIITKWEWGVSEQIEPNVSVTVIIRERIPNTIKLNILATVFSVPIGILLGIWAALKKNTITDHIISTLIMIFISIPSFVLISILVLVFGYKLQWLPTQWPNPGASLGRIALAYIIPVFCLSFGSVCGYCRFVRAELCEVMESDYLLLARTKGLTKQQSIVRHALRNAFVPILPSILAEVIGLLSGSMILESLYCINGTGSLFIDAIKAKDYNVLFVDMAIFTTIGLLAGIVLDLSYGFIDPRIRMGAKK